MRDPYCINLEFLVGLNSKGANCFVLQDETKKGVAVLLFMLLISFAWCPKVLKLQIRVKRSEENTVDEFSFDREDADLMDWQRIRIKTGRQRITAITSFIKLCLTPFVGALYAVLFNLNVNFSNLRSGFHNLGDSTFLSLLLVNIICGYIAQVLAKLGCKLGLQRICFALPLLLSTPISIILVGAFNGCKLMRICQCKTKMVHGEVMETIILAVLMWLAQTLSTTIYVWQSHEFILAKEPMMFWVPSYDGKLFMFEKYKFCFASIPSLLMAAFGNFDDYTAFSIGSSIFNFCSKHNLWGIW